MSITVQFFASLREQLGKEQIVLTCATPLQVSAVWSLASNDAAMPSNTLCAINMEYVKSDDTVNDNDEVAFFPPVTGG